jgi:DNA-directed RNA polymerase specialized sigma24 family protein
MNGKKAKSLRRAVKHTTAVENSYIRKTVQKEKVRVETNGNGIPICNVPAIVTAVTIQLKEGCQRHLYKRLKKAYKALNSSQRVVLTNRQVGGFTYAQA